jgi:hypothetical protein
VSFSGTGRVVGPGIDCGSACSTTLETGALAVLTAVPDPGATFAGWTGCDENLGRSCAMKMTADRNVSASFTACSDCAAAKPIGAAAQADIGPEGGTLASPGGGLTLVVPPDAVTTTTTFSIQPMTNRAPGGRGTAYELLPSGALAKPVTLRFAYDDFQAMGSAPAMLGIAYQGSDGGWRRVPATLDAAAHTLEASVDHFTVFGPFLSLHLTPATAAVPAGNGSVLFFVDQCLETQLVNPPVSHIDCGGGSSSIAGYTVLDWSVNGVPWGNGVVGTIVGNGQAVSYNAPAVAPTPSVVTVSVRLQDVATQMVTALLAEVEIGDALPALRGIVRFLGPATPDGSGYTGFIDVRQASVFMNMTGSTWVIKGYEDSTRTCTYEPSTFPIPTLTAAFDPGHGDYFGDTYAVEGFYSALQATTETCISKSPTGESGSRFVPTDQMYWTVIGPDGTHPEFPGSLTSVDEMHSGEWVNPDGQVLSWIVYVVPPPPQVFGGGQ